MMAEWWKKDSTIPLDNNNFQKILNFYLFNCPCEIESGSKKKGTLKYEKVSKRAITLRQQGWAGSYLNSLMAAMKHTASGNLKYEHYKASEDIKEKSDILEKGSLNDIRFEMIVISERSDMNLTSAIFYYIRNALAHGSFSTVSNGKPITYYFESAKGGNVKARIRLREETLLKWIKDFNLSPNALKMVLSEERKERIKQKRRGNAA